MLIRKRCVFKHHIQNDLTCVTFPALFDSPFSQCIHVRPTDCFISVSLSQSNAISNQIALELGLSRNVLFESNIEKCCLYDKGYVTLMSCKLFIISIKSVLILILDKSVKKRVKSHTRWIYSKDLPWCFLLVLSYEESLCYDFCEDLNELSHWGTERSHQWTIPQGSTS